MQSPKMIVWPKISSSTILWELNSLMSNKTFTRCSLDHCCFTKAIGSSLMILFSYIDGTLITSSEMKVINELNELLAKTFEMKDLGVVRKILGMSIIRDRKAGVLELNQWDHIVKVLIKFSMKEA